MKRIITYSAVAVTLFSMSFVPAFAATVSTSANISVGTQTSTGSADKSSKIIARSDTAIDARITALNDLNTRVGSLKHVSDSEKASIAADVQTNISGLTTLKAKIDGETDVPTLQTDEKSILGSYRIYALVIPQGHILASADRIDTIADLMVTVSSKLQTRITAAQTAGKDVTALNAALSDYNAKVADSKTQSAAAVAQVSGLTPDQGDKTKADANHTAILAARADIKAGTQDLQAARKDAQTIITALKGLHVNASSTVSTQ